MPSTPKKSANPAYPAEIALTQLRSCLVNLPTPLVNVLVDNKIVVQNVVIEVQCRVPPSKPDAKATSKSIYVGWTGMPSKRKPEPVVAKGQASPRQLETLEIDSAFASLVGLEQGAKVGILLRSEVFEAHTVNIEPLTPADWEIIELHADFLETHFLSQLRALPNPAYKSANGIPPHPLTLHLSATSTANILVTSIKPSPPSSESFAKISGNNAEVIVAPKSRQRASQAADGDDGSAKSIGSKGTVGKSKTARPESRPGTYLRGLDREHVKELFNDDVEGERNEGLRIWLDWDIITSKELKGFSWVWVSVIRPPGLAAAAEEPPEDALRPALRVVAQLCPWEEAPDSRHAAMSSSLCTVLDARGMSGDTIRIEPAPPQASKSIVRSLRVYPFATPSDRTKDGLKFGGKTKADSQEAAQRILNMYTGARGKLLDGPITDGMLLLPVSDSQSHPGWQGGLVKLHPPPGPPVDGAKSTRGWLLGSDRRLAVSSTTDSPAKGGGSDRKLVVEVMGEAVKAPSPSSRWQVGEELPETCPSMVGVDDLVNQVGGHLRHASSTLLTGGLGAGKTTLSQLLAHRLRREFLFHVTYFPCRNLVNEETRISTIRETLNRVFGLAAWGARFGGCAVVILDDLDLLCPAENELEVGNENGRNKHVSEIVMSVIRQHCSLDSRVVLLATAQNKEALHNVIVGGHVVREIVHLFAPDKEHRRKVMEHFVEQEQGQKPGAEVNGDTPGEIDYLELAGRTDGYMPGDLKLLVSRARSEAVIRAISSLLTSSDIILTPEDFDAALKGFTPTSLRNVTLQHSTTTFSSIGGLRETRQTLMETLQYPTLYAPIFAKCPLRLRSGLLLYGYPGCGKTLLASAVAGECGLNFISVKGPEILNKYIGASEKSVRDLFERAQAARPCVLFFDEFDSVAPKRGHDSTGVTDRVVNQLLTQMDGAEGLSGVYVLAATSRPDLIDPALLRPGRLDKSLLCAMPDHEDRVDILRALSSKLKIGQSVHAKFEEIGERTEGYSGADLQAVVYNAQLEAIHDVLGDRETQQRPSKTSAKSSNGQGPKEGPLPDFSYFRIGDTGANGQEGGGASTARREVERAQIGQQLQAYRTAQQRARAQRKEAMSGSQEQEEASRRNREEEREPVIEWTHMERALSQTRPSIGREEVRRLDRIYKEFVASRSGEMPSGQGGNEIGGRSSLM